MSFPTFKEWIGSPEAIKAVAASDDFIPDMVKQANEFNNSSLQWERRNATVGNLWNCCCYELWEMLKEEYEAEHDDCPDDSAECASDIIDRDNANSIRRDNDLKTSYAEG